MAIAGAASSVAGSELGNAMGGGDSTQSPYSTPDFVGQMNNLLATAMNNAIGTSTNYTNQATAQQNQSLNASTNALNSSLTNATNSATSSLQNGLNQSMALNSPLAIAGYGALDAYQDSLGLSRPKEGSGTLANQLYSSAQAAPILQQMQQLGQGQQLGSAPTAPTLQSFEQQYTPEQISNYIAQNTSPVFHGGQGFGVFNGVQAPLLVDLQSNPTLRADAVSQMAQPAYNNALSQYNTQNTAYQTASNNQTQQMQLMNQLQSLGYSPQAQNAAQSYQQGLFTGK